MSSPAQVPGPFVAALGAALEEAYPAVRRHLALSAPCSYQGVLRRIWRRGISGRIAARLFHLDGDPRDPASARFELQNELVPDVGGHAAMTWIRTHGSGSRASRGVGLMRWLPSDRMLVDVIGVRRWLEVELVPCVVEGAVVMTSARQWARVMGVRVRLPAWIVGSAETREWEGPDGRLGLSLTLRHPLFGDHAGYEAILERRDPA